MNPNLAAITHLEKALECVEKANGITEKFLSDHPDYDFARRALNQLENYIADAIDDIETLGP